MHQLGQRWDVVYVLQAFAHRLQHDREVRILACDVEQLRGTLMLPHGSGRDVRIAAFAEAGVTNLQLIPATDDPAATVAEVKEWVS